MNSKIILSNMQSELDSWGGRACADNASRLIVHDERTIYLFLKQSRQVEYASYTPETYYFMASPHYCSYFYDYKAGRAKVELIIKNPCAFSHSEVLRDDTSPRKAISQDQLNRFFEFINSTPKFKRFYNEIAVLAYTGVRVSELCALTIGDVDFEKNRIAVNKQTAYTTQRGRYIETTKTESGNRYITIDPLLLPYLQEAVCAAKSRKLQPIVDGHSGFLFVTKHGEMCLGHDITTRVKTIWSKYNATHEEKLPNITPHILRHTFCTRCIELGIDVKSVQYFMGHASASVTMDIYSHASYASAEKAFMRVHSA